MNAFLTVLRLAVQNRWKTASLAFCSLLIGALWGANIGVFYPFLETVFYGESVPESLKRRIDDSQIKRDRLRQELQELRQAVPPDPGRIALLDDRLQHEIATLKRLVSWKPLADRWLPATPFRTIGLILTLMALGTILKGVCLSWNDVLVVQMSQRAIFQWRAKCFRKTLLQDLGFFSQDRTGKLLSRFTHDTQRVAEGVSSVLGESLREPFKMLACLGGAALISWRLLLLSLLLAPPGLLLLRWLSRWNKRVSQEGMSAMADLYAQLNESLQSISVIKCFSNEGQERRKFHVIGKNIRKKLERAGSFRALVKPLVEVVGISIVSLGILAGGWMVLNQQTQIWGVVLAPRPLSPAALMIFFAMLVGATDPLRKLAGLTITVARSTAAAERIVRTLQREPEIVDPSSPLPRPSRLQLLRCEGVDFRYPQGELVLKNVSLTITAGERVALVGSNGSGKSTLLKLLLRLHDPTRGAISLNGHGLPSFRQRDYRRLCGLMPQKTILFDDTVANNIRYGRPWASDGDVQAAAVESGAHEFIMRDLPDGYSTRVGEAGGQLSGGQAQKISLARAILRCPQILLMDEPTSHLDAASECELIERFKAYLQERTAVMVTHRPALLSLATRVVLLERGQIVDSGTPAELLGRSASFRRMIDPQERRAA